MSIFFNSKSLTLSDNTNFYWGYFTLLHKDTLKVETILAQKFPQFSLGFAHTQQAHTNKVNYTQKGGVFIDTDALLTNKKNLVLTIYTADCLPIVLLDKKNLQFSIIHSGWRGTNQKIIQKVIEEFQSFHSSLDLWVDFLPSISSKNYEVGLEFKDYFTSDSLTIKDNHLYFSNQVQNIFLLDELSIPYQFLSTEDERNICTYENLELASYRRNGKNKSRLIHFCFMA